MSNRLLGERYELIEKIGDGGMAVVYKSRDRLLNRMVAIKILKPEYLKDYKFIESFRRESQAAASMSHPNIVNIFDVGSEGNIYYIVMELVEGTTLSKLIAEKGFLKPREAVSIAKQVSEALSHAHKNNIIHRDVKPHNILITEEGVAKIADFGIAKAITSATISANAEAVMGSVHYFSPEQARGGYVDEKSDIYSLGVVLFEMLTGQVPFDGDNPVSVAVKHVKEEMPRPSSFGVQIPPQVEEVVLKATQKYQTNRYASADEMTEALSKASLNAAGIFGGFGTYETASKSPVESEVLTETLEESDEEEKAMKGKRKIKLDKVRIAAIVLAVLLAIPFSRMIIGALNSEKPPAEVEVPYIIGMDVEAAESALEELGLKLIVGGEVNSLDYDEGLIVSQDPLEGMVVKQGKTIKVNISKGVEQNTIPSLIGRTVNDATFLIENYGYVKGNVSQEYNEMPEGVIIRQFPEPGSSAGPGTVISLVVSLGEENAEVIVPSLLGSNFEEAKETLAKLGLLLSPQVNYAASNEYAEKTICDQDVAPGHTATKGSSIKVTLSTGPDQTGGNETITFNISYDSAENEVFYLTIMVSDDSGVSTPINNQQRLKSNGQESFSVTGNGSGSVKIYFDNNLVKEYNVNFDTGAVS